MALPFENELNELFRSNRSVWWKMAIAVVVGLVLGAKFCIVQPAFDKEGIPIWVRLIMVACCGTIGPVAVVFLLLKDVVDRRIENFEPVNPLLRIYLSSGVFTVIAWIITSIALVFAWCVAAYG